MFTVTRLSISLLLVVGIATSLVGQKLAHKQGELIVQLKHQIDGKHWADSYPEINSQKQLINSQNIWLIQFDFTQYAEVAMRQRINKDQEVIGVQFNRFIDYRNSNLPNDPLYINQWQYNNTGQIGGLEGADINACPAWDMSTGGLTANGDTIVVCVIDNGIDEDHEDLIPNLWINYDEIPDNGIDDDNNGFIDDYKGWNTANDNNDINGGTHGTSVAGIVGAKGNNSIGVAGINWTVKLMIVRNNFLSSESEIIQAYGYALDARKAYDRSEGTEGAYVVATNASWGINNGDPDDSPIWCALYDTLGTYGILNVGATTNTNTNVDVEGDLPTTCPSDYLIAVTNMDTNDEKVRAAGYGTTSIDLGAHGEDVFTTRNDNSYGSFGGTSAATPMVTGAVGLLYSAPSGIFGELLVTDPSAAALFVRNALLMNTRTVNGLDTLVATGGVLDLGAAMSALLGIGDNCLAPTSIETTLIDDDGIRLSWNAISSVSSVNLRYRSTGSSSWTTIENATSPYELTSLQTCQLYDVQLLAICGNQVVAAPSIQVETDGCCRAPEAFDVTAVANQRLQIQFNDVLAANNYSIRYRVEGTSNWTEQLAISSPIIITGLANCTNYEVEISSNCSGETSGFGSRLSVQTSGCGACLDESYCIPSSVDNSSEYIANFNFSNRYNNASGAEENGYRNYGEIISLPMARGATYPIELQPNFTGNTFNEVFTVWIDFDQNGFFSSSEKLTELTSEGGRAVTANVAIPDNASLGNTRMRIVMRFNVAGGACTTSNFFGEVEDYCIDISDSPGCIAPSWIVAEYDETTEQVTVRWPASDAPGGEYLIQYRPVNGGEWTVLTTTQLSITLDQISVCENYDVEVYSSCGNSEQSAAKTTIFNSCSATNDLDELAAQWDVFPNPTNGIVNLSWQSDEMPIQFAVYNLQGQLYYRSSEVDVTNQELDLRKLSAGVYLIEVTTKKNNRSLKRLIVH